MSDPEFLPALHRELTHNSNTWECEGLQAITFLAWGLVLATIRSHHSQPTQGFKAQRNSAMLYVYVFMFNHLINSFSSVS